MIDEAALHPLLRRGSHSCRRPRPSPSSSSPAAVAAGVKQRRHSVQRHPCAQIFIPPHSQISGISPIFGGSTPAADPAAAVSSVTATKWIRS